MEKSGKRSVNRIVNIIKISVGCGIRKGDGGNVLQKKNNIKVTLKTQSLSL